jgi:hypothetical protein
VHPNRKMAKVVLAVAMPLGILASISLTAAPAWAKTGTGTVTCSGTTAKVTFKPPLVPGTKTSNTDKSTIKPLNLTGCTAGGKAVPNPKVTATPIVTSSGNSCSTFASSLGSNTISFLIKWKGGIAPTHVSFGPGTVALNSSGFAASGGTATGSYAGTASFSVHVSAPDLAKLTTCVGGGGTGVSSILIDSGSGSF